MAGQIVDWHVHKMLIIHEAENAIILNHLAALKNKHISLVADNQVNILYKKYIGEIVNR